MRDRVLVPPIKSQGIKTKLVPWINDLILRAGIPLDTNWFEPFFGTGVVGFNSPLQGRFVVGDTNPHIINFYKGIQSRAITTYTIRTYLESQAKLLASSDDEGYAYYREVKTRFNEDGFSPYDFIFLSRAGFNGMMRFNRRGEWNIPFCKKPDRFAPAYITKISNQVKDVSEIIASKQWEFINADFVKVIEMAGEGDLIYCDPPYYGRYTDYYNGWTEQDEERLFNALSKTKAKFILSTWHHNDYRNNDMIDRFWNRFNVVLKDHFYHGGGKIENRKSVVEALVYNFEIQEKLELPSKEFTLF